MTIRRGWGNDPLKSSPVYLWTAQIQFPPEKHRGVERRTVRYHKRISESGISQDQPSRASPQAGNCCTAPRLPCTGAQAAGQFAIPFPGLIHTASSMQHWPHRNPGWLDKSWQRVRAVLFKAISSYCGRGWAALVVEDKARHRRFSLALMKFTHLLGKGTQIW